MKFRLAALLRNKLVIAGVIVFVTTALAAWYAFAFTAPTEITFQPQPTPPLLDDRAIPESTEDMDIPESTPKHKDYATADEFSVLILGYGGPGHQGGFLTDVVILATINLETKSLRLIHIPRDIWITIPTQTGSIQAKINAALSMGIKSGNYPTQDVSKDTVVKGAYLTKQAVAQITSVSPDLVIGIDFSRFSQAINALRGIDVTVTKVLDDAWYPVAGKELEFCDNTPEEVTHLSNTLRGFELERQFPCRYERLLVHPGLVHMDGDLALKFARSRHSTSDFDRGERQMAILLGVRDKLLSLNALENIPKFYATLSKAVKTDISLDIIKQLGPRLVHLPTYQVKTISLSTANVLTSIRTTTGASALVPKTGQQNYQEIHVYINQ